MMSRVLGNCILVLAAAGFSVLAAESLSRLVFSPVDFLLAEMERDPVLNHRIKAGSAGHDAWGFRNASVPVAADIVAVGDSMTYGVAATFQESWPYHLSNLTGVTVYNLALGGYGPLHYLNLLESRGLGLSPDTVIVALYFGNDFMDAYNLVYSNDHWLSYRGANDVAVVDAEQLVSTTTEGSKSFDGLRNWLAKNSVIYRVVTQSKLGNYLRDAEIEGSKHHVIRLDVPGGYTYMVPDARFPALDLEDLKILEGIELTRIALSRIQDLCDTNGINLKVALVPTKELVYAADVILAGKSGGSSFEILVENEERVRSQILEFLATSGIDAIDLLHPLRTAARTTMIYPVNDGHPNGKGYLVIAEEIRRHLTTWIDS